MSVANLHPHQLNQIKAIYATWNGHGKQKRAGNLAACMQGKKENESTFYLFVSEDKNQTS